MGHPHNERADELAKAGLDAPRGKTVGISQRTLKLRYRNWSLDMWNQAWKESKEYRQTKHWFPQRDSKKS